MTDNDNITVSDAPDQERYEVRVDDQLAGFAAYRLDDGTIDFHHTEVDDEFSGRGLAQELARQSLDEARSRGLQVLPHCSFYAGYIAKNPEYADLVPADRRAEFDLA